MKQNRLKSLLLISTQILHCPILALMMLLNTSTARCLKNKELSFMHFADISSIYMKVYEFGFQVKTPSISFLMYQNIVNYVFSSFFMLDET